MLENKRISTVGAFSAAIAGLTLAASLLLPSAALAADECGTQIDSGNPESFNCPDGSYGSGVTYTTDGDLTLNFNNGSVSNIGGVGIGVTGVDADSVTIDSASSTTELDSAGATGALVGVTTVDGDIDIDVEDLDADNAPTTHGIYAESTGAGSIVIDTTGVIDAQSGTNPSTSIGIEAITNSGDIAITTGEAIRANLSGIQAEVGGAGTLDIVVTDGVDGGIDAATGTGLLSIDIASNGSTDTNFSGVTSGGASSSAIRINAGGDAQIDIGEGRQVTGGSGSRALNLTAVGQTTVNNSGFINAGTTTGIAVEAFDGTLVLNNDGEINGRLEFSALADDSYTFNNNAGAIWRAGNTNDLGQGAINNAGTIRLSRGDVATAHGATFTGIGDGVLEIDRIILDGRGQLDCSSPTIGGCLDLTGGTTAGQTNVLVVVQKGSPTFVYEGNVFDPSIFLGGIDRPLNPGVVLVDVGGGSSSADHFVLDPASINRVDTNTNGRGAPEIVEVPIYAEDPVYGAVLRTGGLFDYALLYNPDTQQHILASVPQHEALEYIAIVQETLSIWHTTADAVAGRQADLRAGAERGGWARLVSDSSERDAAPMLTTHGNTFVYDQGYDFDTQALLVGYDVSAGEDHVLGLHVGLSTSSADFDDSNTRNRIRGATLGAYGGWWNEAGLTLDGTFNVNVLSVKHSPDRDLEKSDSTIRSLGARVEAGWRLPLGEAFFVQPLATAAYVHSNIDGQDLRFNDAEYENTQSTRAALGVRLGGGMDLSNDRVSRVDYWLTARAWEEYAGDDVELRYEVAGSDDLVIEDDISGSFEEVGLGASLTSPDGKRSVFLSGNLQSGDQTDSTNITLGARLRW